jgi:hypothetical protein
MCSQVRLVYYEQQPVVGRPSSVIGKEGSEGIATVSQEGRIARCALVVIFDDGREHGPAWIRAGGALVAERTFYFAICSAGGGREKR